MNIKKDLEILKEYFKENTKSIGIDEIYKLLSWSSKFKKKNREALSARVYFAQMFGKEFHREDSIPVNFALNYGYKIIASYISKCIASRGMVTQLGIHHIGESNPFNLTYDFIESFRVIVDLWVSQNVDDIFTVLHKKMLIGILETKVNVDNKWISLKDGIEDIIDSYIAFLNDTKSEVLRIDFSKGIRYEDW